jgi:hypothetical protein
MAKLQRAAAASGELLLTAPGNEYFRQPDEDVIWNDGRSIDPGGYHVHPHVEPPCEFSRSQKLRGFTDDAFFIFGVSQSQPSVVEEARVSISHA